MAELRGNRGRRRLIAGLLFMSACMTVASVWKLRQPRTVTDVGRYGFCLESMRKRVAPEAMAHFPQEMQLPTGMTLHYWRYPFDPTSLLVVRVPWSVEEARQMYRRLDVDALPIKERQRDGDSLPARMSNTVAESKLDLTEWPTGMLWRDGVDSRSQFVPVMTWSSGPDPGTDWTTAGLAINQTTGVVYYWVERHWVPFN